MSTPHWKLNLQMPFIEPAAAMPEEERRATRQLVEAVLFSRVVEAPTGNTNYPMAPNRETIWSEFAAIRDELSAGGSHGLASPPMPEASSTRPFLRGVTWDGMVRALVDGQVRLGPEMYPER